MEKLLSIGEVVLEEWCGDAGADVDDVVDEDEEAVLVEAANFGFLIGGLILETFGCDVCEISLKWAMSGLLMYYGFV